MTRSRALWLLYTVFILYGATIPFDFSLDVAPVHLHTLLSGALNTVGDRDISLPDIVQNLIFFAPFGFLWVLSDQRDASRWSRVLSGTIIAAVLSVGIETLQLFTVDRTSSWSDVIANTAGAGAGAVAGHLARWQVMRADTWVRSRSGRARREAWPLVAAALAVGVSTFEPFDATLEVGSVYSKLKTFRADIWQLGPWRDEGRSILLWALLAMTLASFLRAIGRTRPARETAAVATVLAVSAELAQFFIASRMPGCWDIAVSLVGVAIGASTWRWSGWLRPWARHTAIVIATALAATVETLSPFTPARQYTAIAVFPFYGYYAHTTFETLSRVFEMALLYAPLGFCLGYGTLAGARARRVLTTLGLTLAIAGPLEFMQGWIAGRYPDLSDIGMALLGASAGVVAAAYPPGAFGGGVARFGTNSPPGPAGNR